MIRITVTTNDAQMSANVGGNVLTTHKSFLIDAPELESFMREEMGEYRHRQFTAWEILSAEPAGKGE